MQDFSSSKRYAKVTLVKAVVLERQLWVLARLRETQGVKRSEHMTTLAIRAYELIDALLPSAGVAQARRQHSQEFAGKHAVALDQGAEFGVFLTGCFSAPSA